jgi:hypothetical protein
MGCSYNCEKHPIAPVGAKVITWDFPSHLGTWADHGVEAIYLGPAENHLRAFEVWVPNTSASRITSTVWWFLHDGISPEKPLLNPDRHLAYPPSKDRPDPRDNGSDLIGRAFLQPELGVCFITAMGLIKHNQISTRTRRRRNLRANEPLLLTGAHFTLMYQQITTGEEHYSSLTEILYWIDTGPILRLPPDQVSINQTDAPTTTPLHVPATAQYVPTLPPAVSTNRMENDLSLPRSNWPDEPRRQRVCEEASTLPRVDDSTTIKAGKNAENKRIRPQVSDWTEKGCPYPGKQKQRLPITRCCNPTTSTSHSQPLSRFDDS